MRILLFLLLMATSLNGFPFGNPSDPSLYRNHALCEGLDIKAINLPIRVGYLQDQIYSCQLLETSPFPSASVSTTQLETSAAYLVCNFCNRLDLFTTLGVSSFFFEAPQSGFLRTVEVRNDVLLTLNAATAFSWSIGGRGVIWCCGPFAIGAETSYFCTRPHISSIYSRSGTQLITYPTNNMSLKYHQGQFGAGASYRIACCEMFSVVPYTGLLINCTRVDMGCRYPNYSWSRQYRFYPP